MQVKYNSVKLGFLLGIILPIITILLFYLLKFNDESIKQFLISLWQKNLFAKIISLAAISNLLLFFIFLWLNYLYSARGVLLSTFLIAFFVVILKII